MSLDVLQTERTQADASADHMDVNCYGKEVQRGYMGHEHPSIHPVNPVLAYAVYAEIQNLYFLEAIERFS